MEAFEIFSQIEDLESCGGFSCGNLLEKPEDLSDFEPDTRLEVLVLPDVTDGLVSTSSVVTEFCEVLSCILFYLQKASTLLYKYARRDEI